MQEYTAQAATLATLKTVLGGGIQSNWGAAVDELESSARRARHAREEDSAGDVGMIDFEDRTRTPTLPELGTATQDTREDVADEDDDRAGPTTRSQRKRKLVDATTGEYDADRYSPTRSAPDSPRSDRPASRDISPPRTRSKDNVATDTRRNGGTKGTRTSPRRRRNSSGSASDGSEHASSGTNAHKGKTAVSG